MAIEKMCIPPLTRAAWPPRAPSRLLSSVGRSRFRLLPASLSRKAFGHVSKRTHFGCLNVPTCIVSPHASAARALARRSTAGGSDLGRAGAASGGRALVHGLNGSIVCLVRLVVALIEELVSMATDAAYNREGGGTRELSIPSNSKRFCSHESAHGVDMGLSAALVLKHITVAKPAAELTHLWCDRHLVAWLEVFCYSVASMATWSNNWLWGGRWEVRRSWQRRDGGNFAFLQLVACLVVVGARPGPKFCWGCSAQLHPDAAPG